MDHFGIGAAMQAMGRMYLQSARQTGRTVSLIESVKDGDRIIFADSKEAKRVERLLLERGVKVECMVVSPKEPNSVLERGTAQGRTIFDHSWIEQFYMDGIEYTMQTIDKIEAAASGYGEKHRETKRSFEELAKWR